MSLDTKYRPLRYGDVLGQDATIKVCKEYVRSGHGFRQSYVFAGAHGGGKCVTGDTLVPTSRGLMPIEQLMGPDELSPTDVSVVQEGGRVANASFTYRGGFRDTLRIVSHRGFQVEGTYNHRVRVLDAAGVIAWRRLDEIREGDFLCVNRKGAVFGPGADLSGFVYEERGSVDKGQFTTVPWEAPKILTPKWGRLLGYLVGDGSCLASEYVEVNNAENETKEDILHLLRDLAGHGIETPDKRSTTGLGKLRACRRKVRSFLAYAGLEYVGAGDKEIPWSVLQSSADVCREFLVGYFEADGHVGPGGIEITSKSRKLIRQVQVLLLQFGVVGTVREKHVVGHGSYWRYEIDGTSRKVFCDLVGFSSTRKRASLEACVRQDHSAFDAEDRRITNLRESIPHQHGWVARFYRSLPREHRNRATGRLFRCRRGKCNLSRRVLEILVEDFLHLSDDEAVREHFASLWDADYVFDPVVGVTPSQAEVYDFNVPDGSMFAAAGLMNHNTTCGRILARALLCENPQDGEPCDECASCMAMLADKSENFIEVDAATNSGKDDVRRITEEARYGSFSGSRKIYLFDECHEMSRQAFDALLKPLEDNIRGTQDKQLVCIFCTTEPEKMRSAILSRCAPLFRIRQNTPEEIAVRLAHICDQEDIEHDPEVLPLVAEVCECHVRDAIKAIEGVSMLGKVDRPNVEAYLHMDANALYLELLEKIGFDLPGVLKILDDLDQKVSPATCYERMADVCMLAYRLSNFGAASVPSYWDRDRLKAVGDLHREFLVEFARRFAERPAHSTAAMLGCDVSTLHQRRAGIVVVAARSEVSVPSQAPSPPAPADAPAAPAEPQVSRSDPAPESETPSGPIEPSPSPVEEKTPSSEKQTPSPGKVEDDPYVTPTGVYVNPLARNTSTGRPNRPVSGPLPAMDVAEFSKILQRRVIELTEEQSSSGRPARLNDVGSS